MDQIINDLIDTGLAVVVCGSALYTQTNTIGNIVEAASENKMAKTAGKVLQSITMGCLALWASVNALDILCPLALGPGSILIVAAVTTLAIATPLVIELGKRLLPDQKEGLETLDKLYSATCKATNIAFATMAIGFFAYVGAPVSLILPSGVSILSSAYTLYQ